MYSKALLGYEKVVGPDNPRSQSLQGKLHAFGYQDREQDLKGVRELVTKFQVETSHLGAKRTLSKYNATSYSKSFA